MYDSIVACGYRVGNSHIVTFLKLGSYFRSILPSYSCPCCLQLFLDRPSFLGPHLSHLQYCVRQLTGVESPHLGCPNSPSYALTHQATYYRCRRCKSVTVLPCVGIRLNGLSPVHCPRCCVSFSDASLKGGFRNPSSFPSPFNLPP